MKKYRNTLDIHDEFIIIFNPHKTPLISINLIISSKSLVAPQHQTLVSEKFVLRERPAKGNIAGNPWKSPFKWRLKSEHPLLVGGFNPSEKYESQWEGLYHILWKIKHVPNHQPDYI